MIPAVDPSATYEYTLPDDTDNPTVWELRALTTREKLRLDTIRSKQAEQGETHFGNEAVEFLLRSGIVGWRNFGATFNKDDMGANIDVIPETAAVPIALHVLHLSYLTEEERKNS